MNNLLNVFFWVFVISIAITALGGIMKNFEKLANGESLDEIKNGLILSFCFLIGAIVTGILKYIKFI